MALSSPFCQLYFFTAGFPLSAAADLGMDILDYVEFMEDRVAVVKCAGGEETIAECSITVQRMRPPKDLAAVTCIGGDRESYGWAGLG